MGYATILPAAVLVGSGERVLLKIVGLLPSEEINVKFAVSSYGVHCQIQLLWINPKSPRAVLPILLLTWPVDWPHSTSRSQTWAGGPDLVV